jgi:signal transduction histidine kinase
MTIGILASIIFAFKAASREIRLSQMKSDFIANISHELKTPLTSIRTFGELLQAGWISDPQQVRESGASIESESRRLTQLVDNILDLSQIESRQRLFHFEDTDLGEVVADALKTLAPPLQQKGFQVVCQQLNARLPPVRLDREAIAQVLTNLIDNAAKYSGQNKRIVLNLEALHGRVAVSVRDYGIGIPFTEKERIFERFHRANTGFLHDVRGSGIGLSIVKHIVEAHGGRVSVESTPGEGSVFTVSFPNADDRNSRTDGG